MAAEKEPARTLLPYLQRADELQKHELLVAYYCRLYAMELGLKIPQSDRTNTTKALLVSLMKQLEKDKKSLVLGPQDHLYLEGFASNVFAKADKQDRAGRADLNTAKTFYAASIFLDILNQFGQLEPDLEQKQKYAVWKAADIRKALNEGRKPLPGPPGGESVSYTPNASSGEYQGAEFDGNGTTVQPGHASAHPARGNAPEPDLSPDPHLQDDFQHPNSSPEHSNNVPQSSTFGFSPQSPYSNKSSEPSNVPQSSSTFGISPQSQYPTEAAHQSYYPQQYQPAPQPPFPQHYSSSSPEVPPYTYPNFQSYSSFSESSPPSAPTHYPSYHQGSDYSQAPPPSNATPHPSNSPYNSSGKVNGSNSDPSSPPSSRKFEYDSSYQPPPEKIAEAHKAARFAVGALAFDDVSVAVDHLIKSLELLTNPSANN